ncbi:sialate O-acetylesterase [Enterococcus nangangensis]|uniref:sialate O-acetylesterase n=1 Tax=Enterococcus nangangensis TaxID=2559926 RepID=UPI0010F46B3F|nr:sialate O-acetylesterase [Enterococcus nangangensis]
MLKNVDIFLFAGQSNMAGRGTAALAPQLPLGQAYEYRAISAPEKLHPLVEPFGINENNPAGIDEPGKKTGSLVASFCQEYYQLTQQMLVGVSASKGGSSIREWQPEGKYFQDSVARLEAALLWLKKKNYRVNRCHILWLQGETDGDLKTSKAQYQKLLQQTFKRYHELFPSEIFVIEIGNHQQVADLYVPIQEAQEEVCQKVPYCTLVSQYLKTPAAHALMKDLFHYQQAAYNYCGLEAATNVVRFY